MHFVNELHRCANCEPFCARSLSPIPGSSRWLLVQLTHPSLAGRCEANAMTVSCVAVPELGDLSCACGAGAR